MTTTAIRLPRCAANEDIIDTLTAFHEALRDVTAWIPTIIDEQGHGSPRDARWLRSFLTGPLRWHCTDEDDVMAPWLGLRNSAWLDACLARTAEKHAALIAGADDLCAALEPLCSGQPVARLRYLTAARHFAAAVEDDLRFEDDVILPTSRLFLDAPERAAISKEILNADETRPWQDVAIAGDAPVIHRVHAVKTHNALGLEVIRSFAACPRRRATSTAACAGCPHLEAMAVDHTGVGHVACAIDDTPAPSDGAPRVGDVMTRDVLCVETDVPLLDAAKLLNRSCITGMPVVDDEGRAVGVLSQTDIIDAVAHHKDISQRVVRDVMMHLPFVVKESDVLEDAAWLLVTEGVHRLPVVNAERTVVGIVSTLDLLKACVTRASRGVHVPAGVPEPRGSAA